MEDKTLTCKNCGAEFIFTAKEQEFYAQHNFSEPLRCKPCRDERNRERANRNRNDRFERN
ncbi:MAG: zinc-ribbon domain-containing protein [Bacilli bacterium]|nr:zinc-ribbon domain-containing protein [Bacilli bacterium]